MFCCCFFFPNTYQSASEIQSFWLSHPSPVLSLAKTSSCCWISVDWTWFFLNFSGSKEKSEAAPAKIWGIFSACGCSVSATQLLGPWKSTGVWCLFWHRCHFSQNAHRLRKKSTGEREEKIVYRKNFDSEIKSKSTLLFLKKWRSAEVKTLQNSDISSEVDLNYSILRSLNAPRTISLVFWFIVSHCLCCTLALSIVWQQILLHPPWRPALFSCIHFLCV